MTDLAYELTGPAPTPGGTPPLLLLHAFPLDRSLWSDVAALLADHTCVLVDLPGAGNSGLPDGEPSLGDAVIGVLGVLDRIGAATAVVAGVSMGGYVALRLAAEAPHRMAALALIDTKEAADEDAARAQRLRVAADVEAQGVDVLASMPDTLLGATTRARRPEIVARVAHRIAAARPDGVAWAQRAMAARPDHGDTLARLTIPVTVVVGEEDLPTPPASASRMASRARDAELIVIPECGHLSPWEAPEAVAAALRSLLGRV